MDNEKFSFSKLETFNNCKRSYYYNYILKERSGENIYSYCGSCCHDLTQAIIQEQETNQSALQKFLEAVDDADMLGLEWISDNVKNNYVECISHFFENYSPIRNDTIRIEEYFEININGVILRGYIDLWYRIGNDIYIIDLKTSSKFSKKDLPKKSRQLLLYAIALQEKYPDYNVVLQFNMMKYALNKRGTLIERNKFDLFDDFEDAIVTVDVTEEAINEVRKYVTDTVKLINSIDKTDIEKWTMDNDPEKDFFCKNLCSHRVKCLKLK